MQSHSTPLDICIGKKYTVSMGDQYCRSFLALEIPKKNKADLLEEIDTLRNRSVGGIKWVNGQNLHITLKFFGKFRRQDIYAFEISLKDSLKSFREFELKIGQIGAFPNISNPRVVWFGLIFPKELTEIYRLIENCSLALGYDQDDKSFSPHLTVGRTRKNISISQRNNLKQILTTTKVNHITDFPAKEIIFYRSDLTPNGPIYSKLFEINFSS